MAISEDVQPILTCTSLYQELKRFLVKPEYCSKETRIDLMITSLILQCSLIFLSFFFERYDSAFQNCRTLPIFFMTNKYVHLLNMHILTLLLLKKAAERETGTRRRWHHWARLDGCILSHQRQPVRMPLRFDLHSDWLRLRRVSVRYRAITGSIVLDLNNPLF